MPLPVKKQEQFSKVSKLRFCQKLQKPYRIIKGNNSLQDWPLDLFLHVSICLKMSAKFHEIPSMGLQNITEGWTDARMDGWTT